MKAVLFGASKGMGRALARLMAARGCEIVLLGRAMDDLERSARDLEIHGAATPVKTAFCDLSRPESFAAAMDEAQRALGSFDTVVVTAGMFATQDELENDPALASRLLTADFTNTVLFCEEARKKLLAMGGGALCAFSSVAGERGRKPVVLYGAAKAGLSQYMEGLDHKFRGKGLAAVCVKPGFVATSMTAGLKRPPFAGTPEKAAQRVLQAIDHGEPEVYVPRTWRWIMWVIRDLPRFVMRRIEF
jgi:short-subunit dehydrogenase